MKMQTFVCHIYFEIKKEVTLMLGIIQSADTFIITYILQMIFFYTSKY